MSLTGEPDGAPQKSGIAYADLFTGLYASVAILAALRERDRSGRGAHIDMALLDTQVAVLANQALNWMVSGDVPPGWATAMSISSPTRPSGSPTARSSSRSATTAQFERLCGILGLRRAGRGRAVPDQSGAGRQPGGADPAAGAGDARRAGGGNSPTRSRRREFRPGRSTPSTRCSPIRRSSIAACRIEGETPGLASPIVIDGKRQVARAPGAEARRSPGRADPIWSHSGAPGGGRRSRGASDHLARHAALGRPARQPDRRQEPGRIGRAGSLRGGRDNRIGRAGADRPLFLREAPAPRALPCRPSSTCSG